MTTLLFAVLLWGFLHSLLASSKAKKLLQGWLGASLGRFYRLAYNIFAGISFLNILLLAVVIPDRRLYLVPMPWSLLMVIGELLAIGMLLVGFREMDVMEFIGIRQVLSNPLQQKPDNSLSTREGHLVVTGLYRYVRHPLYTAGIAFIWLIPFMTVNILVINIAGKIIPV